MKLVLLENEKTVDFVLNESSGIKSEDILLCFSHFVYQKLEMKGYNGNYLFFEDLFDERLNHDINDFSDSVAMNWYLKDGIDISTYENISLGSVIQGEFSRRCFSGIIVKYGEAIRLAKEKWPRIGKIVYDFDDNLKSYFLPKEEGFLLFSKEKLVSNVAEQLNLNSIRLAVERVTKERQNIEKLGSRKIILPLYNSIIRALISLSNTFYHLIHSRKKQKKIYWFPYFNQLSMFENLDSTFILSDFYSWEYFKKYFGQILYVNNSISSEVLNKQDKKYLEEIDLYVTKLIFGDHGNAVFIHNGIDYSSFYKKIFNYLVQSTLQESILLIKRWQKIVLKYRITRIIINEEIGYINRVILLVAKKLNVLSIWIDHGMTYYSFDGVQKVFNRDLSDVVIAPGSYDVEFYSKVDNAVNRECIALGNPSLDSYEISKRRKLDSVKGVMVLSFEDNFYSRVDRFMYHGLYYKELFTLIKELLKLNIKIYYKPHPSEVLADHEEYFNFYNVNINDVNYVGRLPIHKVMGKVDLCVCSSSSVFFESIAYGIPPIFLEPKKIANTLRPPMYGKTGSEVLRYQTAGEILDLIIRNMDNPSELNNYVEHFHSVYAPIYFGKLDGNASGRIVSYLKKMDKDGAVFKQVS